VQITQRVPAYKAAVSRERNITLKNAGAHAGASIFRLLRLLRELKGTAASMANAKVGNLDWFVLAGLQLLLQRPIGHVVDDVVRARSDRNKVLFMLVAGRVSDNSGREGQWQKTRLHLCEETDAGEIWVRS
jgi:hypothetical protein